MAGRKKLASEFHIPGLATLCVYGMLFVLSGCRSAPPTDQQLKEQAAQTTAQVRREAKEAAADAKVAAANAERQVNAIAAGVKEGMDHPGSSSSPVDINTASADQLATLPGISGEKAEKIISHRPYNSPHSLVSKGLISEAEYHRIAPKIRAS